MYTYNIESFLAGHTFAFLLLLCRIGAFLMVVPGFGEKFVPVRIRMVFACLICLLIVPPFASLMPPIPQSTALLAVIIFKEMLIGVFFGILVRMLLLTLDAAGAVIGMHSGLSNANTMNPALMSQSQLPSTFLTMSGIVMIFVIGLDHYLIKTLIALYNSFPVSDAPLMLGDMSKTVMTTASRTFSFGASLAAPFFVIGLLIYATTGIIQRLLPSIQLFFLMLPIQIWGGLALMLLTVSVILSLWVQFFENSVSTFFL